MKTPPPGVFAMSCFLGSATPAYLVCSRYGLPCRCSLLQPPRGGCTLHVLLSGIRGRIQGGLDLAHWPGFRAPNADDGPVPRPSNIFFSLTVSSPMDGEEPTAQGKDPLQEEGVSSICGISMQGRENLLNETLESPHCHGRQC